MLRATIQSHTYNIDDASGEQRNLDLYREGATLYKFIDEGRPTTTKRLSLLFEPSDKPIRRLYGNPS